MCKEVIFVNYNRLSELGISYLVVMLAYLYVGYSALLLRDLVLILESFVDYLWLDQY